MKILIITTSFWPSESPRAHRWSKLAAAFAAAGHDVSVATCRAAGRPEAELFNGARIFRYGRESFKSWLQNPKGTKQGERPLGSSFGKRSRKLYQFFDEHVFVPDDSFIWPYFAQRPIEKLMERKEFETVVSVSLPFAPHLVAQKLKKRWPKVFWLADFGDPLIANGDPRFFFDKKANALERYVLEGADATTVTNAGTQAQMRALHGSRAVENMWIVPPLFDGAISSETVQNERFSIENYRDFTLAYFGALYPPFRSPTALLDFLNWTRLEKPSIFEKMTAEFYGLPRPEFADLIQRAPHARLGGQLSRLDAAQKMAETTVLVNLGNQRGQLLPSKAVDYLASGRPILNFVHGDHGPFEAFFDGWPGIFTVPTEPNGSLSKTSAEQIWAWLSSGFRLPTSGEIEERTKPFRAAALVRKIESIISGSQTKGPESH